MVWKEVDLDPTQRFRTWVTHAFAVVCPATMIIAAFNGWAFVVTFAASIMVYNSPWQFTFPRWSVRKVARVILLLEVGQVKRSVIRLR